jgi:2-iminobutanoate/2-iminopropanoate deaminase
MTERKIVLSPKAPAPIGPYSQAVEAAGLIFCSGQIPLDPSTGKLVEGPVEVQAQRVLDNLAAVLAAAGTGLENTLKITVYVTDLGDFEALNQVMAARFTANPPARAVVQVSALPKSARLEMDLIAIKKG